MVAAAMSTPAGPPRKLVIFAVSDTGRSRKANQDYAYAGPVPGAGDWDLLAVADGLGGHARGEWASQRTIELFAASLADLLQEGEPRAALAAAVTAANATINQEAREQGSPGAATTLVAVIARDGEAWWVNVGDSRLYRWSAGELRQVSADHSWVAEQVRAGALPAEALRHHPNKNVVTRTVGFEPFVAADTGGPIALAEGDALVLCSDGLHGPVEDAEIARTVAALDPELAATRLVQLANEAGGPDNITVVIGRFAQPPPAPGATNLVEATASVEGGEKRRRGRWVYPVSATGVLALAAALATAIFKFM